MIHMKSEIQYCICIQSYRILHNIDHQPCFKIATDPTVEITVIYYQQAALHVQFTAQKSLQRMSKYWVWYNITPYSRRIPYRTWVDTV